MHSGRTKPAFCRRALLFASLLAGLGLPLAARANELWEKPWIEIRTPNFVVNSALDEKRSLELANNLEAFRSSVGRFTNLGALQERVPTTIYLFPSATEDVGLGKTAEGYFQGTMRGNFMVMYFDSYQNALAVLQHEYTHYLAYSHSSVDYPRWFSEGFASVLSTVTVDNHKIRLGTPPRNYIDWLRYGKWEPYSWILHPVGISQVTKQKLVIFYVQSWILVHYLMLGREGHDFAKESETYFNLRMQGRPADEAFADAFGEPVDRLETTMIKYAKKGMPYLELAVDNPVPPSEVYSRALAPDEVAARIGHVCLVIGNNKAAAQYYGAALGLNGSNTLALVGMADVHKFAKENDQAEPLYERAISLEPNDALHELDYAEYFLLRAVREEAQEDKEKWIKLAQSHLDRSLSIDGENAETQAVYGISYLVGGDNPGKGVDKLLVASAALPANFEIKMNLANAYIAIGSPEMAIPILRRIYHLSEEGAAPGIAKMLSQIDPGFREDEED